MKGFYLCAMIIGLSYFVESRRAENISSAWFLPQEGFPVFYRYFNDKVTWDEAEAVCGFHHADLLSVQTSGRMDAARAYLKEIDVTDSIWIGLQKRSPEKPFSWTDGEKLLGEGYWAEPFPKTNEKLCAAIDPASDFRWNSFYCRGPQVASVVCELPVPEWAKKENGCLITSLPSLTVTLVPEVGVIQLLSDCGLDGTRRIACNGEVDREEIIRRLSCDVDAFASTVFDRTTTSGTLRDINTRRSSTSDTDSKINHFETTKTYSAQTRHRRSSNSGSESTQGPEEPPGGTGTIVPSNERAVVSTPFFNVPSHVFPHSPYLASERNAPGTRKPKFVKNHSKEASTAKMANVEATSPSTVLGSMAPYKPLPVLIITGEKGNESAAAATSEDPPIVLMIENKEMEEPFLVPLADDIIINNPSMAPPELIKVDLVEVDDLKVNASVDRTTSPVPPEDSRGAHRRPLPLHEAKDMPSTPTPKAKGATEEVLNVVEGDADVPQRPNRGRLLTHLNHPSFYPRFLNRVLG